VILGETGYEAEPNAIELLPDAKRGDLWTPYRIRRNAWWAVTSGAVGYCAGTRLWRWEANWRETMQVRSTVEAPHLLRGLSSIAWWKLVPDTEHQFLTGGFGEWKKADYATAAVANDGSLRRCVFAFAASVRGGLVQAEGARKNALVRSDERQVQRGRCLAFCRHPANMSSLLRRRTLRLRAIGCCFLTANPAQASMSTATNFRHQPLRPPFMFGFGCGRSEDELRGEVRGHSPRRQGRQRWRAAWRLSVKFPGKGDWTPALN